MSIFGDNKFKKNKVYYRRKSIKLGNYALTFASLVCGLAAVYAVANRKKASKDSVDEIMTSTLSMQ